MTAPLPPSPAEVGDLVLQTRDHVQALGWRNREHLYPEHQVRAVIAVRETAERLRIVAWLDSDWSGDSAEERYYRSWIAEKLKLYGR